MNTEPLYNAILRVLEVCNRRRNGAAGDWREVEDLLCKGLGDAKLERGPRVHVREFMGMPPGSVVPGVAYLTKDGFAPPWYGRTDTIRRQCLAVYQAVPRVLQEHEPSGATWPAGMSESTLIGQVVDVLILVDYVPQPGNSTIGGDRHMQQGTFIEAMGDYGIHTVLPDPK